MRKFDQSLPDLLLDVYEAAANPQHWQVVLQRIANEMEATKASIHVHAFASQSWRPRFLPLWSAKVQDIRSFSPL